jgi:acyl carrier protein
MTDEEKILGIILEETGSVVELDTDFDSLKLDSLGFADLVLKCENAFNVAIPQASLIRMNTAEDILKIIQECRVPISG